MMKTLAYPGFLAWLLSCVSVSFAQTTTSYEVWRSETSSRANAVRVAAWLPHPGAAGWLDKDTAMDKPYWYWVRAVTAETRDTGGGSGWQMTLRAPLKTRQDSDWQTPVRYTFRLRDDSETIPAPTFKVKGFIIEVDELSLPDTVLEFPSEPDSYESVVLGASHPEWETVQDVLIPNLGRFADNWMFGDIELSAKAKLKRTRPTESWWQYPSIVDPISIAVTATLDPAPDWLVAGAASKPDGLMLAWEARPGMTTEFSSPASGRRLPLPVIVQPPQNQSVTVGSNATFTVYATNHAPLVYQWFKDGVPLAGQTATNLVILSATNSDVGGYSVVITNVAGSITSVVAILQIERTNSSQSIWVTALCYCPTSSAPLAAGVEYLVEASGTFTFSVSSTTIADAEFSQDPPPTRNWREFVDGDPPMRDRLDLLINGSSIDWFGSSDGGHTWAPHTFSPDHVYRTTVIGSNAAVLLAISDFSPFDNPYYDDNAGGLLVSIKPIFEASLPSLVLSVSSLTNTTAAYQSAPNQSFTLRNTGTNTMAYAINVSAPWLAVSPISGSSGGEMNTITVHYQTEELPAGQYAAQIVVSAPGATNSPQVVSVQLTITNTATIADALDWPGQTWTTSGDTDWAGQVFVSHDGTDAARSGPVDDNQLSRLETTITGPGTLRWWWKVSSETGYDHLKFHLDGQPLFGISGEWSWEQRSVFIPAGAHPVRWIYLKDSILTAGQDAAWVDQVSFEPSTGLSIVSPPRSQTNYVGGAAVFSVTARGELPITYQWRYQDGGSTYVIPADTNATMVISNLILANAAYYFVTVSNAAGVTNVGADLTVLPVPPFEAKTTAGGAGLTTNGFATQWSAPPGADEVVIEAATNLLDWTPIYTNRTPTGEWLFMDRTATNRPASYYRGLAR